MADEAVDASGYQLGGSFERIRGFAGMAEKGNAGDQGNQGCEKQDPGNDLEPCKWMEEPTSDIDQEHTQYDLPGEATEEAMRLWVAQGWDGNPDDENGTGEKKNCLDHVTSLLQAGKDFLDNPLRLSQHKCQYRNR